MLDKARLQPLQSSLHADGYELEAWEEAGRIGIRISASAGACADCLVPENVMRGLLGQVLGADEDVIDLTYPAGSGEERSDATDTAARQPFIPEGEG